VEDQIRATAHVECRKDAAVIDEIPPTLIHLPYLFTSEPKPVAQKSFDCCLNYFRAWSGIICEFRTSFREFFDRVVNRFTRKTLPTVNRKFFSL
jgi:hypothetical protein